MTSADIEAVAVLHRGTVLEAFAGIFPSEAPKPTVEDLAEWWRRILGSGRAWMAADPGPVGVVGLTREEEGGRLESLYVDPARWRQGIGSRLADLVEAEAARSRWLPLRLWVLEANTVARSWYEFRGWEVDPGRRRTVWGDVDDIGYRLRESLE